MALTSYINQCRRNLHDASASYWSDAELTTYINEARNRVALDSGSVRQLFNFYLSQSQESYPFSGALAALTITSAGATFTSSATVSFSGGGGTGATATASISSGTISGLTITANGSGYTGTPTVTIAGDGVTASASATIMQAFDILGITVNYNNSWITLGYTYFTEFQAKARFYRNVTGQPAMWSDGPPSGSGGGRAFYIFQIPSMTYQCDIDAIIQPTALVDDNTAEQLQYPYTDCVQYFACYLAKYKQQQFEEAANFGRIYDDLMRRGASMKYQRRIPNAFS